MNHPGTHKIFLPSADKYSIIIDVSPQKDDNYEAKLRQYEAMVHKIAGKYKPYLYTSLTYQDLVQEANLALWQAIKNYDETGNDKASEFTYVYNRVDWHLSRIYPQLNNSGVRPPKGSHTKKKRESESYKNAMASPIDFDDINYSAASESAEEEYLSNDLEKKIMNFIESKEEIVKRLLLAYFKLSDETVTQIQREQFKSKHRKLPYAIINSELENLKDIINGEKSD